ncbi:MAG TPA: CDP-archaeol synthase [Candidatus Saccharimonadales bacterium]|nr:CDP-archaeol synthase [Candidatus Saccharimonadales bacterium]
MYKQIIFALWVFIPAGLANATPVFLAKFRVLKFLDKPMDFGKKLRGKPILGANKTWRGLLGAMVVSSLVFWLQRFAYMHHHWAITASRGINYAHLNPWVVGPAFGFGALVGDAIESFFKRQIGIESGHTWFPFDQIDYVIGGLLAISPFIRMSFYEYLFILLVWFLLHLVTVWVGYLTGFRERPI